MTGSAQYIILCGDGSLAGAEVPGGDSFCLCLLSGEAVAAGGNVGEELRLGAGGFFIAEGYAPESIGYTGAAGVLFTDPQLQSPELPKNCALPLNPLCAAIIRGVFLARERDSRHRHAAIALLIEEMRYALPESADMPETAAPGAGVSAAGSAGAPGDSGTPGLAGRIEAYMIEHMPENPSLTRVAQEFGLSAPEVVKVFREAGLGSPQRHQSQLKYMRARTLLADSQYSISYVAAELGFAEIASFSHFFRKHSGKSPREYRQALEWLV